MLYWRNMKIKILIGLCVLGLVGFVVLIIVQTAKKQ
jgi:preprotein translocase subunit Sss1